jgi:hypothetical protein
LNGDTWEAKLPGLSDHQKLRKLVKKEEKQRYPHGKDWAGMTELFVALVCLALIILLLKACCGTILNRSATFPKENSIYIHT